MVQNLVASGPPARSRRLTTLLACCWGLFSAHLLLHSLLITPNARLCLVALLPLLSVWATLERKRWGRLALLGLSLTTLALFLVTALFTAVSGSPLGQFAEIVSDYFRVAFPLYARSGFAAWGMLALAALTGAWLSRGVVVAEFNRGKHALLAPGQRFIAFCLVALWSLLILLSPGSAGAAGNPPTPSMANIVSQSRTESLVRR